MKSIDLFTNEEFIPKRINQKFANSENRIKFYNNKANEIRHSLSYIDKPLHQNFKIITQLMQNKSEAIFHKEFLKGCGITFNVYTAYKMHEEKPRPAIYNFLIVPMEDDKIKIIKQ